MKKNFFDYSDTFYVTDGDFNEMIALIRDEEVTPEEAMNEVACGYDDADFYNFGKVEEQVLEELKRRLEEMA